MDLRYCLYSAGSAGEMRHPQEVMRALGIKYQHATPQSIADQWWFWSCEDVPAELPVYLTKMDIDPMEWVGFGLSDDVAKAISERRAALNPGGSRE